MKIAILGGSFDPIHLGHMAMAHHVLRHHLVQEVWFMVTQSTPLKDRPLTPFATRAEMIQAAIRHERHIRWKANAPGNHMRLTRFANVNAVGRSMILFG